MTVKSRHCYVKVTSSSYVPSQLIHELLGSPFVLPSNCESVAFPLVFWVRCFRASYRNLHAQYSHMPYMLRVVLAPVSPIHNLDRDGDGPI